ncbi:Uma2 family endonuclease [Leptolyngbya sp. FACHB-261]|nr:Uma2 family endonuclease [Leptolyngbya sp. FACHB-261]
MFLTQDPELPPKLPSPESEEIAFPPSDLWSDEPPLESDLHLQQMVLLLACLNWWWRERSDFYAAGNLTIYYSPRQRKCEDFRGSDFFVVLGTERKPRRSWTVWHEDGLYPNVIVELLSQSTANTDRGLKKEIYERIFRTPDYFWFDPETLEFAGFHLVEGQYQPLEPTAKGWLWSQQLELYLGLHERQPRFFTPEGQLVPTEGESEPQRKELAQQQAEVERQQKELAQQRAESLDAKLRELGVDPDTL